MPKDATTLYYVFSTIAQCAAALAALIGFLGLWRLDRLREALAQAGQSLRSVTRMRYIDGVDPFNSIDLLVQNARRIIDHPEPDEQGSQPLVRAAYEHWLALGSEQQRLMDALVDFLPGTLVVLVVAIVFLAFADGLYTRIWLMRVVGILAGLWLGSAPAYVVFQAAGGTQAMRQHGARRADQLRRLWTRDRTWRGLALISERLQALWRSAVANCQGWSRR
jgi:hypothetical protein